jgi:hypothetical protein
MIEAKTAAVSAPTPFSACRICRASEVVTVLSFGNHALTGVFPTSTGEPITKGPLKLVWCQACTLLQLAHSHEPAEMYGDNYGDRSSLNRSMTQHLARKTHGFEELVRLAPGVDARRPILRRNQAAKSAPLALAVIWPARLAGSTG